MYNIFGALFTENDVIITGNWVDNGKTLREQGIVESEVLLLKRKLFFKEISTKDTSNPLKRNILYEQVTYLQLYFYQSIRIFYIIIQ